VVRIGICEWTTFPASFEDELAAYRAAGAGAIGILEFKLDGVDDIRGKLRERGLAVSACLPAAGSILPSPLIPGPEAPEARIESICRSIARFAELEPSCIFFLTGPGDDRGVVVEGIRRIAESGARHGVPVALEPIHPSQADVLSPVSTFEQALELIGDADVGILFDTPGISRTSRTSTASAACTCPTARGRRRGRTSTVRCQATTRGRLCAPSRSAATTAGTTSR
jgi:sugar phosphate isomerase/epimerase